MYLFIDTSKTYMYIRWQCFNCYPSWFVVETAIGVSTCDPSETNTQINHIHRTTSFFERSKDVKTMIDLKSRFTNVDLLSSRFVIIAICGCEFLRLLIVNHILTFLVQHVASSFWIVNFVWYVLKICIKIYKGSLQELLALSRWALQHARCTCIPA